VPEIWGRATTYGFELIFEPEQEQRVEIGEIMIADKKHKLLSFKKDK
jgi:hypothetical protein